MSDPEKSLKSEKRKSLVTTIASVLILVFVAAGALPPAAIPVMEELGKRISVSTFV